MIASILYLTSKFPVLLRILRVLLALEGFDLLLRRDALDLLKVILSLSLLGLQSLLKLDYLGTELSDVLDQQHIVVHALLVVLLVDLAFDFNSLPHGSHRVLQVLPLLVVLLPDVRVDVAVLGLLVLDVSVEELVNSDFELLVVIDVVGCPEDSVLESIDELLVKTDDVLVLADHALEKLLSTAQVLDHISEVGILLIVFLQFFVHSLC